MPAAPSPALTPELSARRDRLLAILRQLGSVAVAFSGGIDSTVVARAAQLALGDRAVAVTADSPSVARAEIEDARQLARLIGIRHRLVATDEFADAAYVRNDGTLGYRELRVRLHEGELARIEVPAAALPRLADPAVRDDLVRRLKGLGFRFVTLDLEGFRSGSLNTLVSLENKRLFSTPGTPPS